MSEFFQLPLLKATFETLYMVFIASLLSLFFGLMLGAILFVTREGQILARRSLHQVLGLAVNLTRSIPFIILMISVLPLTRLLVGTTIGIHAAIVPLTLAAIPFFARVCENALAEVPWGLIEAAYAMGASPWQILLKVLLPESLPGLIRGGTLTIIGLIGYSAMAGAVGGGGLGELAINEGYQRFNGWVMLQTVVVLMLIVQGLQMLGDWLTTHRSLRGLLWSGILLAFLCVGGHVMLSSTHSSANMLKVGIIAGISENIMQTAQQVAEDRYHLHLQIIPFSDYVQPNTALSNGSIDANIFQHIPYLNAQIAANGYALRPLAKTFVYPLGFYSKKIQRLEELPDAALIAIPNDPSNEYRALLLLQKQHLITLRSNSGTLATISDIIENPKHLQFKQLDAALLPRTLQDADLVALTNDFVTPAGFTVRDALLKEGADSPYVNVIVVRQADKTRPELLALVKIIHSPEVIAATNRAYPNGGAIIGW